MTQIIAKILDSILANVNLTLVASAANIWKIAGDLRDLSSRFEVYIFVFPETKDKRKSNPRNSRYLVLNIVNKFILESTCREESTNFKHQNSIEPQRFLQILPAL